MSKLFEPTQLGALKLQNRVVMAPMTRSRAIGNVPNQMMAEHYAARATAGLIITEGTSPSPNGLGYARIPGLFNAAQVAGWRLVTDAVHKKGGRIFVQLMHTGRVSHPANMAADATLMAPSAIQLSGQMWTDTQGQQPYPVPKEMTDAELKNTMQEYVHAAQLAVEAGFDGIELHAANGYLLEQFLNPKSNQRKDAYGQDRMKFILEVAEACVRKIGGERVGLRLSPYGTFNDMGEFPGIDDFYTTLTQKLSGLGLVYIHIVDHSADGAPSVSAELKRRIRENFKGSYILSGGYDVNRANRDLLEQRGDLVAFGKPFLNNPDLVEKLKAGAALKAPDFTTLYTPGPKGYTQLD
jgi:N-ethylmaleimide reductase